MKELISYSDFLKIEIRLGTIISVELNNKLRKLSYVLKIDFEDEIGVTKRSTQLNKNYKSTRQFSVQQRFSKKYNYAMTLFSKETISKNTITAALSVLVLGVFEGWRKGIVMRQHSCLRGDGDGDGFRIRF